MLGWLNSGKETTREMSATTLGKAVGVKKSKPWQSLDWWREEKGATAVERLVA